MEFQFKVVDFSSKVEDFFLLLPYFFEQRICIGEKGRIKPRFIGENGQSSRGAGDVAVRGVSE